MTCKVGLIVLAFAVNVAVGLKCWETPALMNRMDVTRTIRERTCSDNDKSCIGESYQVGKMWCK